VKPSEPDVRRSFRRSAFRLVSSSFIIHSSSLSMSRILITSGPTRQYLDPVRYLTNASSGRMGAALATAAVEAGHQVVVVSGPADVTYPAGAEVVQVVSTEDMLAASLTVFPTCDGLIAVAAPCDYRPIAVAAQKIRKTGKSLRLELVETPDIVAAMAAVKKPSQWLVAFALETEDQRLRAMQKLERKSCDLIVVNGPEAIDAADTRVEVLDRRGIIVGSFSGDKNDVAKNVFHVIQQRLIP
jgi:phosphopantothenoylcysteine decarboxylase / phosphopantothenate---cysteine ligase